MKRREREEKRTERKLCQWLCSCSVSVPCCKRLVRKLNGFFSPLCLPAQYCPPCQHREQERGRLKPDRWRGRDGADWVRGYCLGNNAPRTSTAIKHMGKSALIWKVWEERTWVIARGIQIDSPGRNGGRGHGWLDKQLPDREGERGTNHHFVKAVRSRLNLMMFTG